MKTLISLLGKLFSIVLLINILIAIPTLGNKTDASSSVSLNIKHFLQCDNLWRNEQLGTCPNTTICSDGCAISVFAGMLSGHGLNCDPKILNNFCKQNNNQGYDNDCELIWEEACKYPGSAIQYKGFRSFSLTQIKNELDDKDPVILHINASHFIIVTGYLNSGGSNLQNYIVLDPLIAGQRNLSQYSNITNSTMRVFDNVIRDAIAFNFTVNGSNLNSSYVIWKSPPIPNNYYRIKVSSTNLPSGYGYSIYLVKNNVIVAQIAANVTASNYEFVFSIPRDNPTFPDLQNGYQIRITPQGLSTIVAQSEAFSISAVPTLSAHIVQGNTVQQSQTMRVNFSYSGGLSHLVTGNITFQHYQNGQPLANIGTAPVTAGYKEFVVPLAWVGENHQVAVTNSLPPSNIALHYFYTFSNQFSVTPVSIIIDPINAQIPSELKLYQNYPNPFNPTTNVQFDIPKNIHGNIILKIFDISGKEVMEAINKPLSAGKYEVTLDLTKFSSGIYFYKFVAGDYTELKKMVYLK